MPWYHPNKVRAHGSANAKVYLMNEAPGPREAISGYPSFGDQGGNIYRALLRANISWATKFNNNLPFSWPKFCDAHYHSAAGKRNAILRKEFLEIRRTYITCSNSYDRWPQTSEDSNDWVPPDLDALQSKENIARIRREITSVHEILLICGSCAWRAIVGHNLKNANEQIGRKLIDEELLKANRNLGANFKSAFYMGHTSRWGRKMHKNRIDIVVDMIRPYLDKEL